MKKFSRCVLILIVVAILSGIGAYFYEDNKIKPVYESVAKLYVVPGEAFEASIRSKDGGLNDDFTIIFTGDEVINAAKEIAGTTEDIKKYITVSSPANSNIVEIRCVNPSQSTAKTYVDAVAQSAVNTTIIPVESIKIFSEGTSTDKSFKPDLYEKTITITLLVVGACLLLEIIVVLFLSAFKKKDDNEAEYEYERRFGKYAYIEEIKKELLEDSEFKRASGMNSRKTSDSDDILDDDDDLHENKDVKASTPSKEDEAETVKPNASSVSASPSGVGAAVAAAQTTYSYMTDDKREDNGPRYSAYGALIDDGKDSEESKQEEKEIKTENAVEADIKPEDPATETVEETTKEPVAEVKEEVTEEPVAETVEETTEEPVAEVKEEITEEPATETIEETTEAPEAETVEEAAKEPEAETVEETAKEPLAETVEETEESAAEVKEEVTEEPVIETTEEAAEEPEAETAEETAEEAVEEPVAETVEETVENEAEVKKSVKIIGRICK